MSKVVASNGAKVFDSAERVFEVKIWSTDIRAVPWCVATADCLKDGPPFELTLVLVIVNCDERAALVGEAELFGLSFVFQEKVIGGSPHCGVLNGKLRCCTLFKCISEVESERQKRL